MDKDSVVWIGSGAFGCLIPERRFDDPTVHDGEQVVQNLGVQLEAGFVKAVCVITTKPDELLRCCGQGLVVCFLWMTHHAWHDNAYVCKQGGDVACDKSCLSMSEVTTCTMVPANPASFASQNDRCYASAYRICSQASCSSMQLKDIGLAYRHPPRLHKQTHAERRHNAGMCYLS